MSEATRIRALLVDDDKENLTLLEATLNGEEFDGYEVKWIPCSSFEEADERLAAERFDLVVSDVYRDREGIAKNLESGDSAIGDLVVRIRRHGFCPILIFSSGTLPEDPPTTPFVLHADKSEQHEMLSAIRELLETGIPAIAARLHRDLDHSAGSYLWDFLEREWVRLRKQLPLEAIERLVRRRAALILGRLDSPSTDAGEATRVETCEYYIYPSLSPGTLRFGQLLRRKEDDVFHVILTPHCDLVVQAGAGQPRADTVLLAGSVGASSVLVGKHKAKNEQELASRIGNPSNVGKPKGRYWFLPGFLDIPDLYCDFMRLTSVPYEELLKDWIQVAVLDSPFAEALQVAFTSFYARVGTRELFADRFAHLLAEVAGAGPKKG